MLFGLSYRIIEQTLRLTDAVQPGGRFCWQRSYRAAERTVLGDGFQISTQHLKWKSNVGESKLRYQWTHQFCHIHRSIQWCWPMPTLLITSCSKNLVQLSSCGWQEEQAGSTLQLWWAGGWWSHSLSSAESLNGWNLQSIEKFNIVWCNNKRRPAIPTFTMQQTG